MFWKFYLFLSLHNCKSLGQVLPPWGSLLHRQHRHTQTHALMHTYMHIRQSHTIQVQIQDCGNYWNVEIRNKIYINRTAEMFQLKGYIINPASYSPGYFSETNEDLCSSKNLYADVYRNFIIVKNWKHPWFYFS